MNGKDWVSPDEMEQRLQAALARGLPGRAAQRTMAHHLAYGRHHGPVPSSARRAAVLLGLVPTPTGWVIPAVLRPATMRAHADQVSLPGGSIDRGETPELAALREFEEELGVPKNQLRVIGQLTPIYVFVSGFEVTPILAVARAPLGFRPSPLEVAAVLELPLADLLEPTSRGQHTIERRGLRFAVPHFALCGRNVWGATSLILAEFAALVERL